MIFFFKQKTAYEMRISDWSSDVCSSDLPNADGPTALATGQAGDVFLCHPFLVHAASWPHRGTEPRVIAQPPIALDGSLRLDQAEADLSPVALAIGRASCRERVCQTE